MVDILQQAVDAFAVHQDKKAAAKALGIPRSTLRGRLNKAARLGIAPGHFEHGVAPGYAMGKVTVQRGPSGQVERTWERQSPDQSHILSVLEAASEAILANSRGALKRITAPKQADSDLLTVIPLGDPHFGLRCWAEETGEHFDLAEAERVTLYAVDQLCTTGPASETALLLNLGDFFHADNGTNRTPRSGATLDVDGRFEQIARVGIMALVRCVQRLLQRHKQVIVRNNRGNHDPHQAAMLTLALLGWFHNEPRVQIETTASGFYYHRFGKVFIGSTHGDGPKLNDLPLIMATDMPDDWAASTWRVWHCGHFHHDQVKEHPGCRIETHRTLAAGDAWHRYSGYRSGRDLKAIVYHRELGEVLRTRCGV